MEYDVTVRMTITPRIRNELGQRDVYEFSQSFPNLEYMQSFGVFMLNKMTAGFARYGYETERMQMLEIYKRLAAEQSSDTVLMDLLFANIYSGEVE